MARVLAIRQPTRSGGLRRTFVTDERATHRKRDDRVDRQGLARAVKDRRAELGMTQKDLENVSEVSSSTIRLIENAQGTRHYRSVVLSDISRALEWPEDSLHRIFYRRGRKDSTLPSEAEIVAQEVMTQLKPHLEKIDAIDKRLSRVMDAIHQVNNRLDTAVGPFPHSTRSADSPDSPRSVESPRSPRFAGDD
jgi:transcriptional regulator with XRE-family HTH domain